MNPPLSERLAIGCPLTHRSRPLARPSRLGGSREHRPERPKMNARPPQHRDTPRPMPTDWPIVGPVVLVDQADPCETSSASEPTDAASRSESDAEAAQSTRLPESCAPRC